MNCIKHTTVFYLCVGIAVCIGCAACDLIETRTPESPISGSSTFVPPTSPDLVLSNLEHAVAEKNTENYVRCLTDTTVTGIRLTFIPAAAAAGRYASTFASWSLQSERSYFAALVAFTETATLSQLTLTGNFSILASDSAVYDGNYRLIFHHGVANIPETVNGNIQLVLRADRNSIWWITRWTDIAISEETSWSEWKGRFAN